MLDGRVCIVTGASSGIGLETARGLARSGARVVLVGRDPDRLAAAVDDVRATTGSDRLGALRADFASLADVRRLAQRIAAEHEAVHVLVNNAGLWSPKRELSVDGHEQTFAVNHLAPYLLTRLLIEPLARAAPSRVVTVSSRQHEGVRAYPFDDPQLERGYGGMRAYRLSKLANVMFANELARRLAGRGVTSNSVHPGDAATRVVRAMPWIQWMFDTIARPFLETAEQASRTSIHVASAPELAHVTGRYFKRSKEHAPSPCALDDAACARLWSMSAELVGLGDAL